MRKTAWRGVYPRGKHCCEWSALHCVRGGESREGGTCVSCFCICVYSTSMCACASIWTPLMPAESFLNRPCTFQSFSLSQSASLFFYHPLATMHVSFSLSCLPLPPYVSFSLSITFSGSPGQTIKCCNLSLSPILTLPPSLPFLSSQPFSEARCSWITALTTTCKRGKSLTKSRGWREVIRTYLKGGQS